MSGATITADNRTPFQTDVDSITDYLGFENAVVHLRRRAECEGRGKGQFRLVPLGDTGNTYGEYLRARIEHYQAENFIREHGLLGIAHRAYNGLEND